MQPVSKLTSKQPVGTESMKKPTRLRIPAKAEVTLESFKNPQGLSPAFIPLGCDVGGTRKDDFGS